MQCGAVCFTLKFDFVYMKEEEKRSTISVKMWCCVFQLLEEWVEGGEGKESYENQVHYLWFISSALNDLLPQLIDCPQLNELVAKLFR